MGMFDYIYGNVKCPNCDNIFEFSEQVKWTNDPTLTSYKPGGYIDADDGEYDYATYVRPDLIGICPKCNEKWRLKAVIKNQKFLDLAIIEKYVPIDCKYGDSFIEYLHRKQKDIDEGLIVKIK